MLLQMCCEAMSPFKFVIKCGNFAVLVDLHVLPLGSPESTSWFTADQVEEVASLVRDPVDQRVKQYEEVLHVRRRAKQKKELAPASAFFMRDLRLFPERYVVCVSCPEDASVHHGNPSLAATELSEQTRSEYFSSVGETRELLRSPRKTKKTVLQTIAKQACVQQEICGSTTEMQQMERSGFPKKQGLEGKAGEAESRPEALPRSELNAPMEANHRVPCSDALIEPEAEVRSSQRQKHEAESEITQKTSKRCETREDPGSQLAKKTCLGSCSAPAQIHSTSQTLNHNLPPLLPLPPVGAMANSKAFPVSECKKTTLEVELLTPGKQAQRLLLASNNTAKTNQNRPAASLRGLSVKPASSGSSIGSRSAFGEEGSENVPRTSRLRRTKRS
ncbi:protein SLX4IP isoform X3 [Poecilia latipinna]|uniref:SLX4 interacting protein n=1 Tax=Poecilia latipinna TaxID=48699 RepID=A0A3B3UZG5_9TELE|nr:PREDICTED: protein SLX4IP isoform X3 [Poecilia formosa]XP_014884445.1 PREDICTED: protein SLX4IP isoform X3 [Poecilia latipinna]